MMRILPYSRLLAHAIEYQGATHRLAIAALSPDRHSVAISPFEREVAATPFVSGTVAVEMSEDGTLRFVQK